MGPVESPHTEATRLAAGVPPLRSDFSLLKRPRVDEPPGRPDEAFDGAQEFSLLKRPRVEGQAPEGAAPRLSALFRSIASYKRPRPSSAGAREARGCAGGRNGRGSLRKAASAWQAGWGARPPRPSDTDLGRPRRSVGSLTPRSLGRSRLSQRGRLASRSRLASPRT